MNQDYKTITTEDMGVKLILGDGELIGIIVADMKTRTKRCFKIEEMSVEEIAGLMTRTA